MLPKNQAFVEFEKQLQRLLKSCNLKVEFSFSNANSKQKQEPNQVLNGETKKKKKCHKILKQAKEMKLKMALSGDNQDLSSFADLVNDKVNSKRASEEDSSKSVKAKKKKKSK